MANFLVECVESYTDKSKSQYSRFILSPLDRGQGTTVGNAFRRVLLGNLLGAGITAVRISGVNHEFATVVGVREDVMDLMLNLKQIVLKSFTADPQIGRIVARGPCTVTAADLNLPSEVEVVNPGQYVATLSEGAVLELECKIEVGVGYRMIDRSKDDGLSIDFLQIDAVFMPVRTVRFFVEDSRIGGVTKDKLILDITTDGSLSPQEALSQSAQILVSLFTPLQEINLIQPQGKQEQEDSETKHVHIEELGLSVRAYNCLKRAQINTVADLLVYSQEDLLEIKNFGQKSAEEVVEALRNRLGLNLPETKSQKVN